MNDADWTEVERGLRDTRSVDRRVAAAEKLHRDTSLEDVPRLMNLLKDGDFFVREAAAWPVCELIGPPALPELLSAYQRGLDEGHDNDGFTTALVELVQANKAGVSDVLGRLVSAGDPVMRKNAEWLREFCED